MKNISRRDFIKGAAVSAATLALAGCSSAKPETEVKPSNEVETSTKHSWEVKPEAITDIAKTVDTEILVVGGGYAGCATAAAAAEKGAKVILIEKDSKLHGNGVGGTGVMGSRILDKAGIKIDKVDAQKRWVKTCGGRCRESLVATFMRESEDAMNWLLDIAEPDGCGVLITQNHSNDPVHKEDQTYHMLYGGTTFDEVGMTVLTPHLLRKHAEKFGAEFVYNTAAEQLVQDESGKVTGVVCKTEEGYVQYNASKGVVLATGDISYNKEMMEYFAPIGNETMLKLNGAPTDTGDGHLMASWAGAALQEGPWPTMMHPQAAGMFSGAFLFVSPEGKRFMNEGTWVQGKCVGIMRQAKAKYAFSIFDKNFQQDVVNDLPYGGGMFWDSFRGLGTTYEDGAAAMADTVANGLENDPSNYFKADTLEELADMIGVDKDTFLATCERYNAMVDAGEDSDFYKDKEFLHPLKEAPFYATRIGAGLLAVVGGVHVNDDWQCLTADDQPIDGLYAVGNVSGDMYAYDYPINVMGNSHGRCLVSGKHVGDLLASK